MTGIGAKRPRSPYNSKWRAVRLQILERDGWLCRISGPGCEGKADTVDHIMSLEFGGARLDPENLRAACGHCNSARGAGVVAVPASRDW